MVDCSSIVIMFYYNMFYMRSQNILIYEVLSDLMDSCITAYVHAAVKTLLFQLIFVLQYFFNLEYFTVTGSVFKSSTEENIKNMLKIKIQWKNSLLIIVSIVLFISRLLSKSPKGKLHSVFIECFMGMWQDWQEKLGQL